MKYRLFFGEVEIGEVVREDGDFPNVYGVFRSCDKHDHQEIRDRIQQYMDYSAQADRLAQQDDDEWERYVEEHEPRFVDLIEATAWRLVDEHGESSAILIPNFDADGGLVWRWNPKFEQDRT